MNHSNANPSTLPEDSIELGESFETADPVSPSAFEPREEDRPVPAVVVRPRNFAPSPPPAKELPHSLEAEENLLSIIMLEGASDDHGLIDLCYASKVTPAHFYEPKHGKIFASCERLFVAKKPIATYAIVEELKARGQLDEIGGVPFLTQVSKWIPTAVQASFYLGEVQRLAALRKTILAAQEAIECAHKPNGVPSEIADNLRANLTTVEESSGPSQLITRIQARRFNHATPPADPQPRFSINRHAVCTPGNLTNLIAQAKAGKTAFLAAMISAAICAEHRIEDRDTLGITATAPGTRRLLHFDTEQSPFDHDQLIRRSLRRAGVDSPPSWLDSFGLAGFNAAELHGALLLCLKAAKRRGGLFAVIIDGTADLVNDVNDPEECNAFVAQLHGLAIEYDCPIINVVHENPGQDGGKMRGHLGSQLERKAESNLRLRKSEEITVVFSEKMRKAPILERDGPRFKWSEGERDHVSCESAGESKDHQERESLIEIARDSYEGSPSRRMRYGELVSAIEKTAKCSPRTAEARVKKMKGFGIIREVPPRLLELTA